ncbi:hypothetical protein XELAEV_18016669mg [Xenopus laevis]|uniref:Uncharacterized protein n=1 Tax=Xenopus laevis TaxID=8355 RepID=A0A974HRW8_XENLA|nr:hypothetical protein XELAEV_18016669mg [Xenopus laevis]
MFLAIVFAFFTLFVKSYSLDICIITSAFIGVFPFLRVIVFLTLLKAIGSGGRDFGAYFLLWKTHEQLSANITVTGERAQISSSFEDMVRGQVRILTSKCLVTPSKLDFRGYIIIGLLYEFAFLATMIGERICFLYNTIICERPERTPYHMKYIVTGSQDPQPSSFLYKLAKRNSVFYRLVRLMGKREEFCMECAKVRTDSNSLEFLACITRDCRDSSDEEQVELWLEERGRSKRFRKVKNTEEDEDSDSSMELSDEYQEQSPSSDSSDEETLDEAFSKLTKMKKKGIPRKLGGAEL